MKMLYAAILGVITFLGLNPESASSNQSVAPEFKATKNIKNQLVSRASLEFVQNNPDGRDHSFKE